MPPYAILSHTWGDDEYVFSDRTDSERRNSAGFKKVSGCCALAASQGFQYVWIDTCCIDKTSSAELTESINSMYKWYKDSHLCYAYLSDLRLYGPQDGKCKFRDSRWFNRGWTLQELLAPDQVIFYDADWVEIGSRSLLKTAVSEATGISVYHLSHPQEASVAAKMSWASKRGTTREEDIAYSLLGLFRVNMSLIYGEGQNAFFRLQCEIIQSSSDESIFAWHEVLETPSIGPPSIGLDYVQFTDYSGLLARSPWHFQDSGDIVPIRLNNHDRPPWSLTNQGLCIHISPISVQRQHRSEKVFETRLRDGGDSRLKERENIDGLLIKSMIACARDSAKEAPMILTFRIIEGTLASRVDCWEFAFVGEYVSADVTELPLYTAPAQAYFISHLHHSTYRFRGFWSNKTCRLTVKFREFFKLNRHRSESFLGPMEDGSIITPLAYFDQGRLYFEGFRDYSFTIVYPASFGNCKQDSFVLFREVRRDGQPSEHPEERFGPHDEIIKPIDDQICLWITGRNDPKSKKEVSIISEGNNILSLDITSIDHFKALEAIACDSPNKPSD
ncbi:MAG: hypothetical protein Q9169_004119 [Polycauliona sp. 2 TL-2023]